MEVDDEWESSSYASSVCREDFMDIDFGHEEDVNMIDLTGNCYG